MAAANFLSPVVLYLIFASAAATTDAESFLEFSRPSFAVVFACWKNTDKVKTLKRIAETGVDVRVAFAPVRAESLHRIDTGRYEKVTYVLDLACPNAEEVLIEGARFGKFRFLYEWILLNDKKEIQEDLRRVFRRTRTRMDMDVKIILPQGDQTSKIVRVYNPGLRVKLRWKTIGHCEKGRIVFNSNQSYYDTRKNMAEVLIRAGSVAKYPFKTSFDEYMRDLKLKNYDKYSKFHYHAFLLLQEIHGFSYNVTLAPAWYGNRSSGEDGGVAKLLHEDKVDIGSAGGMIRMLGTDRIDFYDYIMPYYRFRSGFYFRNPGVVRPNFYEVMKPLAKTVWYAVLLTSLVFCVCMELTWLLEGRRSENDEYSIFLSILILIGIYAQQGVYIMPKRIAGRIILLNLLVLSLLLYNYYTSSLVSSLISTEPETLKTVRELYESKLKVGMELQPYTITFMLERIRDKNTVLVPEARTTIRRRTVSMTSYDTPSQLFVLGKYDHYLDLLNKTKIYENSVPNFFSVEDGIKFIRDSDFAYHTESVSAYPLMAKTFDQASICDLTEITLINSDTSLMLQKHSQYKKLFQISLRKTWQSGLLKKVYKTWVGSRPECLSSARLISVGMNDVFLPYFLLALGVVASLGLFAVEIVFWKFKIRANARRTVHLYPFVN